MTEPALSAPAVLGLRAGALQALMTRDPGAKCASTTALQLEQLEQPAHDLNQVIQEPAGLPGRPAQPVLVSPGKVAKRSLQSVEGHAGLIHSLAHIELNAVDLALDIIWRYPGLPELFYREWLSVAKDEARHYRLLEDHLNQLGYHYGAFNAHHGLWEMAERTKDDLLARLALVPRTLEARGLDASPLVRDKLISIGDQRGAAILSIILQDEIRHVAIGNRWYRWLCAQRGVDAQAEFRACSLRYRAPKLRGPFNLEGRRAAGFTDEELAELDYPNPIEVLCETSRIQSTILTG
jgi:uncharacterized ferritin-like protein (DUF455 family)